MITVGDTATAPRRLEFELSTGRNSFGTLILLGADFDNEATITAAALAGQAVVALENARLHQIVERQALVDVLTGLANRRQRRGGPRRRTRESGAARRLGRADPRRPGRLQVDQRPLRASDRRPRVARVRRHAPRDPPRDRRGCALGRRGVRRRPARHRSRRDRAGSRTGFALRWRTVRSPLSTVT